jgi:hypothetical protein
MNEYIIGIFRAAAAAAAGGGYFAIPLTVTTTTLRTLNIIKIAVLQAFLVIFIFLFSGDPHQQVPASLVCRGRSQASEDQP